MTFELLHYLILFRGTDYIYKSVVSKVIESNSNQICAYFWQSGGPSWEVKLGREDSLTASQEDSNNIMPSPRANAAFLINLSHQFNLNITDLVALSGSHSIGQARCFSVVFRLYNQSGTGRPDPAIDLEYREKLDELCPKGGDENMTGGLDATPVVFCCGQINSLALRRPAGPSRLSRSWGTCKKEERGPLLPGVVSGGDPPMPKSAKGGEDLENRIRCKEFFSLENLPVSSHLDLTSFYRWG